MLINNYNNYQISYIKKKKKKKSYFVKLYRALHKFLTSHIHYTKIKEQFKSKLNLN